MELLRGTTTLVIRFFVLLGVLVTCTVRPRRIRGVDCPMTRIGDLSLSPRGAFPMPSRLAPEVFRRGLTVVGFAGPAPPPSPPLPPAPPPPEPLPEEPPEPEPPEP